MFASQIVGLLVRLRRHITRNFVILLAVVTMAVVVLGGLLLYLAERDQNTLIATYADAVWLAIVTVTTVGYGDRAAITVPGRTVSVGLMLFGIGFLGLFTASVASVFIDKMLREGRGLSPVHTRGHILICGWNDKGALIVEQLRKETDIPIVILAERNERPTEGKDVSFVRGKPYTEIGLRRADIDHAGSAIILADESEAPPSDARTVLTVLAIESIRSETYTCAEVLDPENVEHLERAGADEILPTNSLAGCLLARACLHPGIIDAVSDVASAGEGAEIYVTAAPGSLVGATFDEALAEVRRGRKWILIGLRRGAQVHVCPAGTEKITPADQLVVIALDPPGHTVA